jgi:hypothetical protein
VNQQMTAVFDAETNRAYPKLLGATAMVAALHLDGYRELRRLQGQVFRLWEGVAIAAHRLDTDPDGAMEALRDCLPIAMELEGMLGPELAPIMERPRRNRDADTIMYRHWRGSLSAAPRNCRDPRSDTS